ncbi:hypothetical protein D9M68_786350 [compost metagenome]
MSNGQQRLTAAFRKLFVETGLFARWVVVKDVFFAILRQGVIRFHIGLIAAWNGRHPALIGRRFVDICSGQVWQRNRFEIHLGRPRAREVRRHRFAAGFFVFRFAPHYHLAPFQLESEPVGVGKVPNEEARNGFPCRQPLPPNLHCADCPARLPH